MLGSHKIMAFAPTLDANKARPFYEGVLGLRVLSQDNFALALDANGIMLRVTNVPPGFKPQQFTILGWQVPDIAKAVSEMRRKGVQFESYGLPAQDAQGIWTAPGGAKVAWFKDPTATSSASRNFLEVHRFLPFRTIAQRSPRI